MLGFNHLLLFSEASFTPCKVDQAKTSTAEQRSFEYNESFGGWNWCPSAKGTAASSMWGSYTRNQETLPSMSVLVTGLHFS